jgi:hypothetical protein
MNPEPIESSIGLDRLATCNEVRRAILYSSRDVCGLGPCDDFREMFSGCSGFVSNLSEEDEWLAVISGVLDPVSS